ncbi:hypothetical protein COV93_08910 [Candidatus Woesearchaeota archaeon CG11_big_fil_rev_8_21_14_0_20_43_8]|nr:MAG: hypothetical protein COV93_08910 [Candidatus Woesearchaeota archaeon CG11_big_fil_rev_8_21_14_0_20_43_8]PIO06378.1 MAG: hypothetical protein COT47_03405 [Candidatus Woesearchaeota archaeon CG08_land_8_20_14_0_20_43_7]
MRDDFTTRPIEELDYLELKHHLMTKRLELSAHALDHICHQQRKLFIEEELTGFIYRQKPRKIYRQANGRLSIHYRTKKYIVEIIIAVEKDKIVVVSFMNNHEIPRKWQRH